MDIHQADINQAVLRLTVAHERLTEPLPDGYTAAMSERAYRLGWATSAIEAALTALDVEVHRVCEVVGLPPSEPMYWQAACVCGLKVRSGSGTADARRLLAEAHEDVPAEVPSPGVDHETLRLNGECRGCVDLADDHNDAEVPA